MVVKLADVRAGKMIKYKPYSLPFHIIVWQYKEEVLTGKPQTGPKCLTEGLPKDYIN